MLERERAARAEGSTTFLASPGDEDYVAAAADEAGPDGCFEPSEVKYLASPVKPRRGVEAFGGNGRGDVGNAQDDLAPSLGAGASGGPDAPPPRLSEREAAATSTGPMTVATDEADYAPGSVATFTVINVEPGDPVAFQIADLPSAPGLNGIVNVYKPFAIVDGGEGDLDGAANGVVVAQWLVPADGSATGATLQLTATSGDRAATTLFSDAPNKTVTENQKAGAPQSVWAIHGSIDNQGDSQIEGFATQISTNAGQTVSFKIDTTASGYTLAIYRLGYYGGTGASLVTSMHHSGATNQPDPLFKASTRTVDAGNWSVSDSGRYHRAPSRASISPS